MQRCIGSPLKPKRPLKEPLRFPLLGTLGGASSISWAATRSASSCEYGSGDSPDCPLSRHQQRLDLGCHSQQLALTKACVALTPSGGDTFCYGI